MNLFLEYLLETLELPSSADTSFGNQHMFFMYQRTRTH